MVGRIGLTPVQVNETFLTAAYHRSRYSVPIRPAKLGCSTNLLDEVFQPGGLWT